MKNLLFALAAVAMFCVVDLDSASAQFNNGYRFGTGFRFGRGPILGQNFGFAIRPREDAPYFAKFPPVYYSHPVARPYGYSPYALPPGIQPAESIAKPQARTIMNPYFQSPESKPEVAPAADPKKPAKKATFQKPSEPRRIVNPYYNALTHSF